MSLKGPSDDAVYREWERLVFGFEPHGPPNREPPVEQIEGWHRLYEECFQDERWIVSTSAASLVATLGATIAFRRRRYTEGVALLRSFLELPGSYDEVVYWESAMARSGTLLVLEGRFEEGIESWNKLLDDPRWGRTSRRRQLEAEILIALDDLGEGQLNPLLARFANILLSDWPGRKRQAKGAESCRTNAALSAFLANRH